MITIDQRILIPAPPRAVWDYISKLENNPIWQVDCDGLTFLSQRQEGVGTRWRQRNPNRQEFVYEVTTWYEGLGYEYVLVDGGGFQSCDGRLRLQEIPEGTIVQWTLNYELGGVFSGLRNALTTQRRIEADMVESLKTLWKVSKRTESMEGYQARSLMQDGPQSPEERAHYQSRHGGKADEPTIVEPPISEEDTKPRLSVAAATTLPPEPLEPRVEEDDSRYAPPPPAPAERTVETVSPGPEVDSSSRTDDEEDKEGDKKEEDKIEEVFTPTAAMVETETEGDMAPKPDADVDTSQMSIWEVFGIPSPTDTQRMRAIQAAEEAEREYEAEAQEDDPAAEARETVEHAVIQSDELLGEVEIRGADEATQTQEAVEDTPEPSPAAFTQPIITNIATQTVPAVEPEAEDEPDDYSTHERQTVETVRISDEFSRPQNTEGRLGLRLRARRRLVRVRRPGS